MRAKGDKVASESAYSQKLRLIKSLLVVSSLQKRHDVQAAKHIKDFPGKLTWEPLDSLLTDSKVWRYVVISQGYDPKLVFCHPDILLHRPASSLYYRGLSGLSLKAVRDYFGAVDSTTFYFDNGTQDVLFK